MENWKVKIVNNWNGFLTEFYIYRKRSDGVVEMLSFGDGTETVSVVDEGTSPKPSFRLDRTVLTEFSTALSENGVKPKEASHTEGKLVATERHLADLRQLLKLK